MLPVSWVGTPESGPIMWGPCVTGRGCNWHPVTGSPSGFRYLGDDHPVIPVVCRSQWHSARCDVRPAVSTEVPLDARKGRYLTLSRIYQVLSRQWTRQCTRIASFDCGACGTRRVRHQPRRPTCSTCSTCSTCNPCSTCMRVDPASFILSLSLFSVCLTTYWIQIEIYARK